MSKTCPFASIEFGNDCNENCKLFIVTSNEFGKADKNGIKPIITNGDCALVAIAKSLEKLTTKNDQTA